MNVPAKLGAFALSAAVVFGAAFGIGKFAGPMAAAVPDEHGEMEAHQDVELPGGLLVTDRGYTLETVDGGSGTFAFRIQGPDGHRSPGSTRCTTSRCT